MTSELQPEFKNGEPVRETAHFLRRIGFALLFGVAPAFAPYYKRSIFLFTTIGAVLLALAAIIEGRLNLRRLINPSMTLAMMWASASVYILWSGLSLGWTPFPGESGTLFAGFVTIILAGALLILFLPDRVSASRLYILVGGIAVGWIISFASSLELIALFDYRTVQRGLITLIPLTCVAMIWLLFRRRTILTLVLVVLCGVTVYALNAFVMAAAFGTSLIVLFLSIAFPNIVRRSLGLLFGGILMLAPLIPFIMSSITAQIVERGAIPNQIFEDWMRIVMDDPFRLLTGHGYDTILRAARAGLIPQTSPHGLLIDVWYELGLIGAGALALLTTRIVSYTETMTRPSAAAALAAMMAIFVIGIFGGNLPEAPWLVSISLTAIAISALERGQYKTARPKSDDIAALNVKKRYLSFLPD